MKALREGLLFSALHAVIFSALCAEQVKALLPPTARASRRRSLTGKQLLDVTLCRLKARSQARRLRLLVAHDSPFDSRRDRGANNLGLFQARAFGFRAKPLVQIVVNVNREFLHVRIIHFSILNFTFICVIVILRERRRTT